VQLPVGPYGVPTIRIRLILNAANSGRLVGAHRFELDDANRPFTFGWRDMLALPLPGVVYANADLVTKDVTREFTTFVLPELFASAPRVTHLVAETTLNATRPAAPFPLTGGLTPLAPRPPISSPPLSEPNAAASAHPDAEAGAQVGSLIVDDATTWTAILASFALAIGFGALHALEPGHGKSLVAAYFVGTRGTFREAVGLGAVIAAAHTAGVLVIGTLLVTGASMIAPARLFPWLQLVSGIMVLLIGLQLAFDLRRRGTAPTDGADAHGHPLHGHAIAHAHPHPHDQRHSRVSAGVASSAWKRLIALGIADGFVPTASTIVLLLAAVALHRMGLGILLIVAFGLGFGTVLTSIAAGLVLGRRVVTRLPVARQQRFRAFGATLERALPIVALAIFLLSGAILTFRAALLL
jgi:ABC-type nickel/cobalt efflux system permease component RcnA